MSIRPSILMVPALLALVLLAGCGSGSDGTGVVSRPQARDVVVVSGFGGHEDIRFNPVGTLYVESVGREVFLLERALVGTIVLQAPPGLEGGSNQINFGSAATAQRVEVLTDDNTLYLAPGANGGTVRLVGDDNIIYVEPQASLDVVDLGNGNVVVGL